MNGKYIMSVVMCLFLGAILMVSPIGVKSAIEAQAEAKYEETRYSNYQRNVTTVETVLLDAVNSFNESRSFDVYYGDVSKIYQVFQGVAGIEVKDVYEVDPMQGYKEVSLLREGSSPAAVKFNLLTTDVLTTLGVFNKMELPVQSIVYNAPNELTVIILTGGDV